MERPLEELFENKRILTTSETTLRSLPNERGVLLFADSTNRPVQLFLTASIQNTVLSKCYSCSTELTRRADLRPVAATVFYTLLSSEYHSYWLYNRLVHLLFPQQADEWLSLPVSHCVRLDPAEPWAAFATSTHPFREKDAFYWGPFPTRREADFFAHIFNTLFVLCRNRSLAVGGQGGKCSYFQMNLCPAPCREANSRDRYQKAVFQAVQAARCPSAALADSLMEKMKTLAAQLQFEQAQNIKNQLEAIKKLQTEPYQWTAELNRIRILHIDKSHSVRLQNQKKKCTVYQAFLISGQTTEKLIHFTLDTIENLLEALASPPGRCLLPNANSSEHLSLTSLFIYKNHPPGLWLNLTRSSSPDPQILQQMIQQTFEKTSAENQ